MYKYRDGVLPRVKHPVFMGPVQQENTVACSDIKEDFRGAEEIAWR